MYIKKLLKFACISILASGSLQAVSLKQSVDKVLATNPEVIAEKNNQEAFRKYIDENVTYTQKISGEQVGHIEASKAKYFGAGIKGVPFIVREKELLK